MFTLDLALIPLVYSDGFIAPWDPNGLSWALVGPSPEPWWSPPLISEGAFPRALEGPLPRTLEGPFPRAVEGPLP